MHRLKNRRNWDLSLLLAGHWSECTGRDDEVVLAADQTRGEDGNTRGETF